MLPIQCDSPLESDIEFNLKRPALRARMLYITGSFMIMPMASVALRAASGKMS